MKKFFRIFIPILLTLAIIFCVGWYLFEYDREFTRDMLLSGARYFDANGNTAIAGWFYDRAYEQAKDNDAVAIELANQHKADGNYTQAELTLSKAIEDGGGPELYIALCKTYIEQDKILDAVKLLNGITNAETKALLDAQRPAAPTASPDPGFYNQYISVTVSGDGGTLYVSPVAEYPSVHDDPYTEPVALGDGENTIYAVVVAENGLVSPLSIFGYTVGGIIEEVTFSDPTVEALIRQTLGVDENEVLFSNELWGITDFTMPAETTSFADLKYMPFLEKLTITGGPTGQLGILSSLTTLESLSITGVSVSSEELDIIGTLTKLETLTLNGCNLSTVTPLKDLTAVRYLDLGNNTLRNIEALSSMPGLTELNLQHNALTDLSSLSALTSMTKLDVSFNSLTSLDPICGITALTWLDASNNNLTEVGNLAILTSLEHLSLAYNTLSDVSALAECLSLKELNISNNMLTDISNLSALTALTYFNFSANQVTAIPAFPTDCALITIDGSHNLLTKLDPLSGMEHLNNIYMDYNEGIESVECLANCPRLIVVNVYGTKVTEVEALTDQSIIVNFNPVQEDD